MLLSDKGHKDWDYRYIKVTFELSIYYKLLVYNNVKNCYKSFSVNVFYKKQFKNLSNIAIHSKNT